MTCRTVWLTGMSGTGKSTIAAGLREELTKRGSRVKIVDGDEVRKNAGHRLGFTPADIRENNRLVAELCKSLQPDHDYLLVAVIAPFADSREQARAIIGEGFVEVYVATSLDTLIARDTKGLYKKALNGELENFIGVSPEVPYEPPQNPDIRVDTEKLDRAGSVARVLEVLLG